METIGIIGVIYKMDIPIGLILGLYWGYIGIIENKTEQNGNYYLGFRGLGVWGLESKDSMAKLFTYAPETFLSLSLSDSLNPAPQA